MWSKFMDISVISGYNFGFHFQRLGTLKLSAKRVSARVVSKLPETWLCRWLRKTVEAWKLRKRAYCQAVTICWWRDVRAHGSQWTQIDPRSWTDLYWSLYAGQTSSLEVLKRNAVKYNIQAANIHSCLIVRSLLPAGLSGSFFRSLNLTERQRSDGVPHPTRLKEMTIRLWRNGGVGTRTRPCHMVTSQTSNPAMHPNKRHGV